MPVYLQSVSTTSGFLEACKVEFEPGLNCIIGSRGTCKSTLVESIRFAFDCDTERVATLTEADGADKTDPRFGLLKATLRAGSVRCSAVQDEGNTRVDLVLERELGAETRIFLDGVREHAQREILHGIEIFSQGDLQRIAADENNDMRLALIDRPNKLRVADLLGNRRSWSKKLGELGPDLRATRAQIGTLQQATAQFESYRDQLRRVREECPTPTPELEAERNAHEQRRRALSAAREIEAARSRLANGVVEIRQLTRSVGEGLARFRAADGPQPDLLVEPLATVERAVVALLQAAAEVENASLGSAIDAVDREFEKMSEPYYRLRHEQQTVNESIKQQHALERQIDHLTKQVTELERVRTAESTLLEQRRELRERIRRIDDELYELRVVEIDAINSEHGDTVQVALAVSDSTKEYANKLSTLLTGSRIRAQEEVAAALAEKFSPSSLIDAVEAGNAQRLSDVLGRDLGQMTRVVAHLTDHPDLYSLESQVPLSRLEITFFDDGQPKPVEALSRGQRATALLPIILRPLPYPLLFDQPEDDLDNHFIFRSLIKTIRSLKHQRQVIFVTHNANIPVLGAAERVIVMRMSTPTSAAPPMSGGVDDRKREILDLLEGGAEAFAERENYYGELLSEAGVSPSPSSPVRADIGRVSAPVKDT